MPPLDFWWWRILLPIVGFALAVGIIWNSRRPKKGKGVSEISGATVPSWLLDTLKDNKEHLSRYIRPIGFQWILGIETEPYVIASANIINCSIFAINVTGVSGSLYIDKVKCNLPATIKREYLIGKAASDVIQIRQAINIETLKTLKQKLDSKAQILMELHDLTLTVQILEPEHEPQPTALQRVFGTSSVAEMSIRTK